MKILVSFVLLCLCGCDTAVTPPQDMKGKECSFQKMETLELYGETIYVIKDRETGTQYLWSYRGGFQKLDRGHQ